MLCHCDIIITAAMQNWTADTALTQQCSRKQRMHHPNLQVQIWTRHIWPYKNSAESQ